MLTNQNFISADRAKQIKTVATINEDPTEILIRELRAENEKLKKMLERGTMNVPIKPGMTDDGEFEQIFFLLLLLYIPKTKSVYYQ